MTNGLTSGGLLEAQYGQTAHVVRRGPFRITHAMCSGDPDAFVFPLFGATAGDAIHDAFAVVTEAFDGDPVEIDFGAGLVEDPAAQTLNLTLHPSAADVSGVLSLAPISTTEDPSAQYGAGTSTRPAVFTAPSTFCLRLRCWGTVDGAVALITPTTGSLDLYVVMSTVA